MCFAKEANAMSTNRQSFCVVVVPEPSEYHICLDDLFASVLRNKQTLYQHIVQVAFLGGRGVFLVFGGFGHTQDTNTNLDDLLT